MGEGLALVYPHHGRVQGQGIGARIQHVQLAMHPLYASVGAVVEQGLRALV